MLVIIGTTGLLKENRSVVVEEKKASHTARNMVPKKRAIATIIPIPLPGLCRLAFCSA
jgi:hypothetical protein